jgi:hypothetical protein
MYIPYICNYCTLIQYPNLMSTLLKTYNVVSRLARKTVMCFGRFLHLLEVWATVSILRLFVLAGLWKKSFLCIWLIFREHYLSWVYTKMLPTLLLLWRCFRSVMFSACNLEIISFFGAYLQKTNIPVTFGGNKDWPIKASLSWFTQKCSPVHACFRSVMFMFSACNLEVTSFFCWHLFAKKPTF